MPDLTPGNPQKPSPHEGDDVIVGWIKGPWGLDGHLNVGVLTDIPTRFSPGSILLLDGQPARVESSRSVKNGLLVKLDSVNDRTRAESLRGLQLKVSQCEAQPLPDGSYYYFQIIDMHVWSDGGEYLGEIREILPAGGTDVYVVKDDGKALLIPALADVVVKVDLEGNKMTVHLPEGLR